MDRRQGRGGWGEIFTLAFSIIIFFTLESDFSAADYSTEKPSKFTSMKLTKSNSHGITVAGTDSLALTLDY